jgi:2-polyprenyl-6-methoxyphenol hydroxylase-like FAD-dependent oxidoreductase
MKALIVGGGIGGLAAAIALLRARIDVEVFERADEIREVGAGISLWTNALHALDRIGLTEELRPTFVNNPPSAGLRSWDGTPITPPLSVELASRLRALCVVTHRADLLAGLLRSLGERHVRLGARAVTFEQTVDGVVVRFADGRSASGDLLIGADGLNSIVRAGLHGNQPPRYSGYTSWRGVVQFDTSRVDPCESWGHGARFGHAGMNGNRVYWYATLTTPEGGRNPDEKAALLQIFRNWHAPIPSLVEATESSAVLRNDIYDRPVSTAWGSGRVTLIGDAAHPMTPNLGQGACQALEDAVVLGQSLARQRDVPAALQEYERLRIPRVNPIVIRSRQVGWLGQWRQPLAVAARNALLKRVSARQQVEQLERVVNYRV